MTEPLLMSSVLPAASQNLAYTELYSDPPGLTALPDEEPFVARSVAKRRNEFITVRHCARIAMSRLGFPPVPILKGDKGEPLWPDGLVGSLTHTTGYRGAVVGRRAAVRSVGVDAEPHDVLPEGVLDAISLPEERRDIEDRPVGLHWDRILFCAKEATYKAWFPLTKRWLGFEDARVTFDADDSASAGRFVSHLLVDGTTLTGPPLTTLSGRWAVGRGLVVTAIVL
ncbi:4'-phosphopantetheinyl transferase PptT [Mycobacterium botniense]|uniref:4'-phosphopantetheinyl transferase n=1 Tax=Mycobacterium botniense TaxID=84962 RepID=A0A7I9Y301_9MYCO|nr:4'-phosphopantetheinyl transferase [Mycobacterium botniense]GFG76420.1 4'-phosphopantetheinyl transferase [Mycobacterium botniense]